MKLEQREGKGIPNILQVVRGSAGPHVKTPHPLALPCAMQTMPSRWVSGKGVYQSGSQEETQLTLDDIYEKTLMKGPCTEAWVC